MLTAPRVEFAERDGKRLAYQSAGTGPDNIVFVAGSFATTHAWEEPAYAKGLRRLASFSRFVTFDQQGMGFSDPIEPAAVPTLDDLVADLAAVIDDAGVTDPILFGMHNGGAVAAAYAAMHPVQSLILCNTWARLSWAEDYPIGIDDRILDRLEAHYQSEWGKGRMADWFAAPRVDVSPRRFELASTTRNQAVILFQMNRHYDIRTLLPSIDVPTLVIHMTQNQNVPVALGEYVSAGIPGARLALIPGSDQFFLRNYADPVIDEVEQFVTGTFTRFADRMTAAMLFTDIVESTRMAASLGDQGWSRLIDAHNDRVRRQITTYGGDEVKCTGDGFLVTFDDPASAIRCALGAIEAVDDLGLELRAGVHFGEVSRMGKSDLAGLAVHFAQRLCADAGTGQVLTSSAAMEQCEDAGLTFEERGRARFKGIPGEWQIYTAHT